MGGASSAQRYSQLVLQSWSACEAGSGLHVGGVESLIIMKRHDGCDIMDCEWKIHTFP